MDKTQAAVDTPNPEYAAMATTWELIDTLMGGTPAMKDAGTKYLPKEEAEDQDVYNVRLGNSVLFNRFATAVGDLKSRPFAEATQIRNSEKLPEQLKSLPDSVDDEGRDITAFCDHCMEIGIQRGMVHLLVDYPAVPTTLSYGQERQMDVRPIILAIDPKDMFAWQCTKERNGKKTLTQIRIRETAQEGDGGFGVTTKERVRVIYAGPAGETYAPGDDTAPAPQAHWELWEKQKGTDSKESWVMIDQGPWTIGKISLVTVYLQKTGFMTAKCPLEPLAYSNLAHWQLASDHRNNLRFALAKLLFGSGLNEEEKRQKVIFGVHYKFFCSNPDADMKVVGDDGTTVQAGESALRHLEEQMDAVAVGPLMIQSSGNQTATGKAIDEGKGQCKLQSWVRLLEVGVNQAIAIAHEWISTEMADDVSVDIYSDFELLGRSTEDLATLDKARDRGDIDRKTYLKGLKARRVLLEDDKIDDIVAAVEQEGPATGMIGRESEDENLDVKDEPEE